MPRTPPQERGPCWLLLHHEGYLDFEVQQAHEVKVPFGVLCNKEIPFQICGCCGHAEVN